MLTLEYNMILIPLGFLKLHTAIKYLYPHYKT